MEAGKSKDICWPCMPSVRVLAVLQESTRKGFVILFCSSVRAQGRAAMMML